MDAPFELDPRLAEDSAPLGRLPLCLVRLHRDGRYPWVLLIPARPDVTEIHQLAPADRRALIEESAAVASAMQRALGADKMNVAALGNLVPQLHVHHVARYRHDDAWPGPIWGAHPPLSYLGEQLERRLEILRAAFAELESFTPAP
jgi:diadenosine tetraphosphate (Ap4A) HIT family hydrolase